MKKNDIIRLEISGLTSEGNGIGRYEGMAIFVPYTAVGDVINCRIVRVNKSYCYGKIEEILTSGGSRIKPDCPVYYKCGGCSLRHISYSAELEAKEGFVRDAFTRIGEFEMLPQPIVGRPDRLRYRNKAQLPVCQTEGESRCGFYSQRSHRVVPFDDCLIQPQLFNDISREILKYHDSRRLTCYDETTGKGLLRHIYIRQGYHSKETMVCLVVTKATHDYDGLAELLPTLFPEIRTVLLNVNHKNTNVILGDENAVLFGNGMICDSMCSNTVTVSPHSFYQINTPAAEEVYTIAREYASLSGGETLVDLYCGAGTVGLSMAKNLGRLIGVEIIPQAVENARANAEANGIDNAEFLCGDAGDIATKLANEGITPDVVVVDPPRKGCDQPTLDAVLKMSPDRFVMISCNPATAARDCKYMCEHGYRLISYRPADLFPGTFHIETVALLCRQKYENEYEEYFMNRTVEDIMIEYGEQRDEWKVCRPKQITDETVCLLTK